MTVEEIARVKAVSHRYGATVALDGVSIDIPARIMVGVIGPDGVGKSTLLALIAGVRRIQQGQVLVFDKDVGDQRNLKELRGRVAYMPQGLGRNLYPTLSVFENIDFFGRLFGQGAEERRERITELLTATGMEKFEARPAGKLSGGMKQKLSLCCALINDPDLLILDEPTTGVDPLSRGQFWDLINSIRARRPQMSVIVATAYMDEAERFDWLMAMDEGKIIATGALKELLAKTGEPNLDEAFIALMPEAKRALHKKVVVRERVASPDETPAIEAEGLTRRFGDFVAVDHVSFRIPRGEIFGFLGSNGCGKSTTMKMLVGFLPATSGTCKLFGEPMGSNDMQARRNVGYMTQAFSLYGELTVGQNLELHAQLYHLPKEKIAPRLEELLERYDLKSFVNARPDSLPLGIKQRLQLAVAVLHEPAILILDEPTSGVDPIARDQFWRTLIDLSRDEGVTIFVTTHFMNEADRCDRISLMHAGRVLAVGAPQELVKERGSSSLEDCFVGYLAEAAGIDRTKTVEASPAGVEALEPGPVERPKSFSIGRLWAYARRETVELLRDPIRMAFAVLGPIILMLAFGYGISFDIENLQTASFDQDDTPQSRQLLEGFEGSRYFSMQPAIKSSGEAERRLRSGNTQIVVEVPPGFGRDLLNNRTPEVDATVDGAMTFRGETAKNYVAGVVSKQGEELQRSLHRPGSPNAWKSDDIEVRFRYNQAFLSVNAMVPSVFMLMLCLIPAIMSAIAVVREKETGSIAISARRRSRDSSS
jgi:ribosome-dependent ATPase